MPTVFSRAFRPYAVDACQGANDDDGVVDVVDDADEHADGAVNDVPAVRAYVLPGGDVGVGVVDVVDDVDEHADGVFDVVPAVRS